jgi:26S proteasome regulatory subunit N1
MAKDEAIKAEKKGEAGSKEAKKGKKEAEDISEEDQAIIEQMQLLVTRSADSAKGIRINALTAMAKEIREATSSMTSVPKPLKFLRPHYATIKEHYANETDKEVHPAARQPAPARRFPRSGSGARPLDRDSDDARQPMRVRS